MDKRLLTILRCPVTHKGLNTASRELLARVNAADAPRTIASARVRPGHSCGPTPNGKPADAISTTTSSPGSTRWTPMVTGCVATRRVRSTAGCGMLKSFAAKAMSGSDINGTAR